MMEGPWCEITFSHGLEDVYTVIEIDTILAQQQAHQSWAICPVIPQ